MVADAEFLKEINQDIYNNEENNPEFMAVRAERL